MYLLWRIADLLQVPSHDFLWSSACECEQQYGNVKETGKYVCVYTEQIVKSSLKGHKYALRFYNATTFLYHSHRNTVMIALDTVRILFLLLREKI